MQPRSFKSTGEKHTRFYRTQIIKSDYDNLRMILAVVCNAILSTELIRKRRKHS